MPETNPTATATATDTATLARNPCFLPYPYPYPYFLPLLPTPYSYAYPYFVPLYSPPLRTRPLMSRSAWPRGPCRESYKVLPVKPSWYWHLLPLAGTAGTYSG